MDALNTWDWMLFAAAGYVAVVALVRLMIQHRNTLAVELQQELEKQRRADAAVAAKKTPAKKTG